MGLSLPAELDLPVVRAPAPYDAADRRARAPDRRRVAAPGDEGRVGRVADGPEDAGHAACTACRCSTRRCTRSRPMSAWRCCTSRAATNDRKLVSLAVGRIPEPARRRHAGRGAGRRATPATRRTPCWPRRWPSSGRSARERTRQLTRWLIERFAAAGLRRRARRGLRRRAGCSTTPRRARCCSAPQPDPRAQAMLAGFDARGAKSVFVRYLREPGRPRRAPTRCWRRSPPRWAGGR